MFRLAKAIAFSLPWLLASGCIGSPKAIAFSKSVFTQGEVVNRVAFPWSHLPLSRPSFTGVLDGQERYERPGHYALVAPNCGGNIEVVVQDARLGLWVTEALEANQKHAHTAGDAELTAALKALVLEDLAAFDLREVEGRLPSRVLNELMAVSSPGSASYLAVHTSFGANRLIPVAFHSESNTLQVANHTPPAPRCGLRALNEPSLGLFAWSMPQGQPKPKLELLKMTPVP